MVETSELRCIRRKNKEVVKCRPLARIVRPPSTVELAARPPPRRQGNVSINGVSADEW